MLGGSVHLVELRALFTGAAITPEFVDESLVFLKENNFGTGVHRGHHKNVVEGKSDCGAADRLLDILTAAKNPEIIDRLLKVNELNGNIFGSREDVEKLLTNAQEKIAAYDSDNVKIKGEELIANAQKKDSQVIDLIGDHQEFVAFVNLKKDTTLDTNGLNHEGKQGFNLDLWAVVEQAKALGIDGEFATAASLILYQATEIVLVEQKGKPALPVIVHS
jgi:hypothetical protein